MALKQETLISQMDIAIYAKRKKEKKLEQGKKKQSYLTGKVIFDYYTTRQIKRVNVVEVVKSTT